MHERETAFAKINLALHVRGRRKDGYHDLETLFVFAEDGDALAATPSDRLSLVVEGPFAAVLSGGDPADNLVLRAATALREAFGITTGAALTLTKKLPVASGIGGGSADAAAALRLLARMWAVPIGAPEIARIAVQLGADVPACLTSEPARGDGRGDRLVPVKAAGLRGVPLLLVNPGVALSTAAVFTGWDRIDRGGLSEGDPLAAALTGRNDLEPPARVLVREIDAVLGMLTAMDGVRLTRMSGSGATCFALFESVSTRDAASARIAEAKPGWWRLASRLR